MTADGPTHRVLLVREWDQQTTGSGCCGRLEGGDSELSGAVDFSRTRAEMERMGEVYRALVSALPRSRVDVQVVDPRNLTFLLPGLLRDARRHGHSWRGALAQLSRGATQGAIVVDGTVVSSGAIPPPEEALDLVLDAVGARSP